MMLVSLYICEDDRIMKTIVEYREYLNFKAFVREAIYLYILRI